MAGELRRPIPTLSPEERKRRLAERGLDENMIPFDATPEERKAAMTNLNQTQTVEVPVPVPVPAQPAQGAILNQTTVKVLTGVAVVAAAALAASEAGIVPGWVGAVAQGVIGLLAAFGIASPGVRKL